MLVLSRKTGENLVINKNIIVSIVEIRGDKVRLGITAPKEIEVLREEVFERIHGKEAADTVFGKLPIGDDSDGN